jgi:hypothetical protein
MGEKADIVEQLRLAEAWFDVDGDKTIPVDKNHGKWLFKTAADEIERLRATKRQVSNFEQTKAIDYDE